MNGVGTSIWILVGVSVVDILVRGFGVRIQRGSLGQSIGKQHLWRLNYLRMKNSNMVDSNNYVS